MEEPAEEEPIGGDQPPDIQDYSDPNAHTLKKAENILQEMQDDEHEHDTDDLPNIRETLQRRYGR